MFDFLSIKSTVESVVKKHEDLSKNILEDESKLMRISTAPMHRDDIKALIDKWIDLQSQIFSQRVIGALKVGDFRVVRALNVSDDYYLKGFDPLQKESLVDGPEVIQAMFCATQKEGMRRALHEAVDAMEWDNEGLPLSKRRAEVGKMEAAVAAKRKDIEVLVADAEAAGIDLNRLGVANKMG